MTFDDALKVAAAAIVAVGGSGLIIVGVAKWLGEILAARISRASIQKHERELADITASYERQRRRLEAALQHTVGAASVHFATEFEATKQLWIQGAAVQRTGAALRPRAAMAPIGQTPEQAHDAFLIRRSEFVTASNAFKTALDDQYPFIADEILAAAEALRVAATHEAVSVTLDEPRPFAAEWWTEGQTNRERILAACDTLARAVRARFVRIAQADATVATL